MTARAGTLAEIVRFEGYLDRAVSEVFATMMNIPCVPTEPKPTAERETMAAVIGLAGLMSGTLVLKSAGPTAIGMAERLCGMTSGEVDATVRDAFGEICNMIAGAWKGLDTELACGCLLSTPTVVAGSSYEIFSQPAPMRIERSYEFAGQRFAITIVCELPA